MRTKLLAILLTAGSLALCQDNAKYTGRMLVRVGSCATIVRVYGLNEYFDKTLSAMNKMWDHGCVSDEDGNIGYVNSLDNDLLNSATQLNYADPDQVIRYDRHGKPWTEAK